MRRKILIIIASLSVITASSKGETMNFKKIVLPPIPNKWDELAAKELKTYLEKIGKQKISISKQEIPATQKGNIYIGEAALNANLVPREQIDKLKFDGYLISYKDGNAGILGAKGAGTLFGAYGFLNKLGIKIYARNCEKIPSSPVKIKDFSEIINPAFELRVILPAYSYWSKEMDGLPLTRQGFSAEFFKGKFGEVAFTSWADPKVQLSYGHTSNYMVPFYKYGKTHPEYYSKNEKGEIFSSKIPGHTHLCLSNPDVKKIAFERITEWINKCPLSKYFCVTQGDGPNWCECEECKKMDVVQGKKYMGYPTLKTDRILKFVNEIADKTAKKSPDKIILTFAYTVATETPPLKEKPAPNVRILLCPYPAGGAQCHSHDLFCPENKRFLQNFNKWLKLFPRQIYIFDYPMNYGNRYSPFFPLDAMSKKLRFYNSKGIKGLWQCGSPRLFAELYFYVQGKLLWNPELNPQKLEDEFLKAYYGNAAIHMKELLKLIRSKINDPDLPTHMGVYSKSCELINEDYVSKAYQIFNKAEKAVEHDPTFLSRVKYEKLCAVLWSDLNQYITKDQNLRFLKLREFVSIAKQMKMQKRFINSISMPEWFMVKFKMPLNLKGGQNWYDADILKKLTSCNKKDIGKFIEALEKDRPKINNKKISNGVELNLKKFVISGAGFGPQIYSHNCPPELAIGIYGKESMSTTFTLENTKEKGTLILRALDDDKPGKTPIEIKINGKELFKGENQASDNKWTDLRFDIPETCLKKGKNILTVNNLDNPAPQRNWIMISNAKIIFSK